MSVTYKLSYFNGKGLAELSRLLFAASGTSYEDFRYPLSFSEAGVVKDEFNADQHLFPMGQVPILNVNRDGKQSVLAQSKAIERYIARETGLMGDSPEEAAQIDSIVELIVDLKNKYNSVKDDSAKLDDFFATTLPKFLGFISKMVEASGSGFCVGSRLSLADVTLFHYATMTYTPTPFSPNAGLQERFSAVIDSLPAVAEVVRRVGAVESIANWEAQRASRAEAF